LLARARVVRPVRDAVAGTAIEVEVEHDAGRRVALEQRQIAVDVGGGIDE
jgi:hypothetical protein